MTDLIYFCQIKANKKDKLLNSKTKYNTLTSKMVSCIYKWYCHNILSVLFYDILLFNRRYLYINDRYYF